MGQEYVKAGVDYKKLAPFKRAMRTIIPKTQHLPRKRWNVEVSETGTFRYLGARPHTWRLILESLGTKSWLAEWMYARTKDPRHFVGIGQDLIEMAVMDLLRQGAFPVVLNDLIALAEDRWCDDEARSEALIEGFYRACEQNGMAFTGGDTPALRLLILIVDESDVDRMLAIGRVTDYPAYHLGYVEKGEPKVLVHTERDGVLTIYPPSD